MSHDQVKVTVAVVCHRCGSTHTYIDIGSITYPTSEYVTNELTGLYIPLPAGWQLWANGPICRFCLAYIADLPCGAPAYHGNYGFQGATEGWLTMLHRSTTWFTPYSTEFLNRSECVVAWRNPENW